MGGAAAAYYLSEYTQRLLKLKRTSFVVAVALTPSLGYRFVAERPIDVTQAALAPAPDNVKTNEWGARTYVVTGPSPEAARYSA
jgi:hypothetical protein